MLNKIVEIEPFIKISQVGFVEVSEDLLKNNSENLLKVFGNIIILNVYDLKCGIVTYKCISKHFRELQAGENIPYYNVAYVSNTERCIFEERK
jgi:hypothetical protein